MPIYFLSANRSSLAAQFQRYLILVTGLLLLTLLLRVSVNIYTTNNIANIHKDALTMHDGENQLLSSMVNQESSLRGYILTSNTIFLQPFEMGRSQYLSALSSLSNVLLQRKFQNATLALSQAQTRAEIWYSTFALPTLHEMQIGNLASARSQTLQLRGKTLFDAYRSSIVRLQQATNLDVTTALTWQTQLNWNFLIIATLLSSVALVLLWFTFTTFRRDLTTQLAALTTIAQHVQAGHQQTRVPTLKHEELEILGQSFNHLIETLLQQQEAIEEHAQQVSTANGEFRALFNAVDIAILFVAHDGHILTINRAFTEFFHLSAEALAGQRPDDLQVHWTSLFADASSIQEVFEDNNVDEVEAITQTVKQITPQKRDLQVQVQSVFSTTLSYLGRLYLFRDITKQNELERLKRDFVSQVSHELRTPLTSIKGFVSLLLEDAAHLNAEQQEFLSIVDENARRLVTLVNDLLDLSRIEAGKIELERTFFALNEIIEQTLQSFTPQLTSKQQSLELYLQSPSPIVFADPVRVQQILTNLVSNAHKYTLPKGTLRISTKLESGDVSIEIQDSGVGMTPEEQAHLFTSFFRAKNRLTEDVGGTGLGLVITHSLVELHGGKMQVESQPGQGSAFRFTLPLAPEALHSQSQFPRQAGKNRVLVVEDNRDNAYLLLHILERDGYEVLTANSGQEALGLAFQEQPDLITLDLQLPDISGFTIFERLKSDPKTAQIPILLLSVLDRQGQSRFLGPIEYLPKPFKEQDLLTYLRRLLSPAPASILMFAASHVGEGSWMKDSVQEQGYTLITATTHMQLLSLIRQHRPSLILLDSELPPDGGLAAFHALRSAPEKEICDLPVLVLGTQEGALSEQWTRLESAGNIHIVGRTCSLEEILEAITRQLAVGVSHDISNRVSR